MASLTHLSVSVPCSRDLVDDISVNVFRHSHCNQRNLGRLYNMSIPRATAADAQATQGGIIHSIRIFAKCICESDSVMLTRSWGEAIDTRKS